jgi:hypothetical protein
MPGTARVWLASTGQLLGQSPANFTPDAGVATGSGGDGGSALQNVLFIPQSLAEDAQGNINFNIRRVDQHKTISTVARSSSLAAAHGLTVDPANNILVTVANRVWRFNTQGTLDSVAGSGLAGFTADGLDGALAAMNGPTGIAAANDGTVYFADTGNNVIRRLTPVTAVSMQPVAGKSSNGVSPAEVVVTASDREVLGGLTVTFSVTSGTATLSQASVITDVHGMAATDVTLTATVPGLTPGRYRNHSFWIERRSAPARNIIGIFAEWLGQAAEIAPGGWVEIKGTNFASETRQWSGDDFNERRPGLYGVRESHSDQLCCARRNRTRRRVDCHQERHRLKRCGEDSWRGPCSRAASTGQFPVRLEAVCSRSLSGSDICGTSGPDRWCPVSPGGCGRPGDFVRHFIRRNQIRRYTCECAIRRLGGWPGGTLPIQCHRSGRSLWRRAVEHLRRRRLDEADALDRNEIDNQPTDKDSWVVD